MNKITEAINFVGKSAIHHTEANAGIGIFKNHTETVFISKPECQDTIRISITVEAGIRNMEKDSSSNTLHITDHTTNPDNITEQQ